MVSFLVQLQPLVDESHLVVEASPGLHHAMHTAVGGSVLLRQLGVVRSSEDRALVLDAAFFAHQVEEVQRLWEAHVAQMGDPPRVNALPAAAVLPSTSFFQDFAQQWSSESALFWVSLRGRRSLRRRLFALIMVSLLCLSVRVLYFALPTLIDPSPFRTEAKACLTAIETTFPEGLKVTGRTVKGRLVVTSNSAIKEVPLPESCIQSYRKMIRTVMLWFGASEDAHTSSASNSLSKVEEAVVRQHNMLTRKARGIDWAEGPGQAVKNALEDGAPRYVVRLELDNLFPPPSSTADALETIYKDGSSRVFGSTLGATPDPFFWHTARGAQRYLAVARNARAAQSEGQ